MARRTAKPKKPVADPGEPHVIEHGNPGEEVEALQSMQHPDGPEPPEEFSPDSLVMTEIDAEALWAALDSNPAAAPALMRPGKTWGHRRVHIQHTTPDGLVWRFTLHQALPDNIWQLVRAENVPVQISVSGVVAP